MSVSRWVGVAILSAMVIPPMLAIGATTALAEEPMTLSEIASAAEADDEAQQSGQQFVFPVDGDHRFVDDWQYVADGVNRRHWGIDIPATRMTPLVAVADGTVTRILNSNVGAEGNMVIVTGADGWRYLYIHLNNDTPGTTDDANLPEFAFAPDLAEGTEVAAGQLIGYVGDSGNSTGPHLHFAMTDPGGNYVNPYASLVASDGVNGAERSAIAAPGQGALAYTGRPLLFLVWVATALVIFGASTRSGGLHLERRLTHGSPIGPSLEQTAFTAASDEEANPTRRRYTAREKERAVRMVFALRAETGQSRGTVIPVAESLGVGVSSLRAWVRSAETAVAAIK